MKFPYDLLAASFLLLAAGTLLVLYRELKERRPSPYAVGALVLIWAAGLGLRLFLSPHTFLHEYFHVAETIAGYLRDDMGPTYGKTGPALFRFAGLALGRPEDVQIIFLTTALIASLAIPALALFDLALMRSWPRALCAAVLLCVLPQHLRFSAAEDLFVHAITFGMWSLALFALYLRTCRLGDVLLSALALSLAMQARPEMLFFPAVVVALVLLVEPRSWRILFAWRTLLGLIILGMLLIPRLFELQQALGDPSSPSPRLVGLSRYPSSLVLFHARVTSPVYWVALLAGLLWSVRRQPGLVLWVALVFVGYTLFSFTMFDNPPYHLRSQLLPTSFVVLIAAGVAEVWTAYFGQRRGALRLGACALAAVAALVVIRWRGFVTELRDQQLEWRFLEHNVARLPARGTLLSTVEAGGPNLNAFPEFLLWRARKRYELIDVRRAAKGDVAWPAPGEDVLYYQGMFCYFAFGEEPPPGPMTEPCSAVHERYLLDPLVVEDLETKPYSWLKYANNGQGPFRIGFFRLKALR